MPVIPSLRRLREEDPGIVASQGYIATLPQKQNKKL
jgi:hypothetical protein